jgi:hypothetical protein
MWFGDFDVSIVYDSLDRSSWKPTEQLGLGDVDDEVVNVV